MVYPVQTHTGRSVRCVCVCWLIESLSAGGHCLCLFIMLMWPACDSAAYWLRDKRGRSAGICSYATAHCFPFAGWVSALIYAVQVKCGVWLLQIPRRHETRKLLKVMTLVWGFTANKRKSVVESLQRGDHINNETCRDFIRLQRITERQRYIVNGQAAGSSKEVFVFEALNEAWQALNARENLFTPQCQRDRDHTARQIWGLYLIY